MSDPDIQSHPTSQFALPDTPRIKADVYTSTAKPRAPLTADDWANIKKPKVLIVGAGIGGLMLGNLLEKGGIPYEIWERAKEVKPLGTLSEPCMKLRQSTFKNRPYKTDHTGKKKSPSHPPLFSHNVP